MLITVLLTAAALAALGAAIAGRPPQQTPIPARVRARRRG